MARTAKQIPLLFLESAESAAHGLVSGTTGRNDMGSARITYNMSPKLHPGAAMNLNRDNQLRDSQTTAGLRESYN